MVGGAVVVLVAAAELEAAGPSERETEEAALKALLAPLGLGIKEIRVSLWLL
jgi:hypothetical protein